ncbi:MAG: 16S rRNA (cytosine(1402)-N(4))-methyltransferase RsmH [bacterium]
MECIHKPVLEREVAELLPVRRGGTYIDGTLGSGGHAARILDALGGTGLLLGIDRDDEALGRSRERLAGWADGCRLVKGNFADIAVIARDNGLGEVDGILLDVGVSSDQLKTPERGFSFAADGPLDARMDRSSGPTAADLVNDLPEVELKRILRDFGEERAAGRVARAIVQERERGRIETTLRLAETVSQAVGGRHGRIHPATLTFQALRIAVNGELDALAKALEGGLGLLAPGGRMAVISFHSLEDRLVKTCFREHAGSFRSLEEGGRSFSFKPPLVELLTRKPVVASSEEIESNPRARSAKLRAAKRLIESGGA